MDNGTAQPAKAPRKSHLALIAGVLVVLFVLYLMGAFGHGSKSRIAASAPSAADTAAAASPMTPAAAASPMAPAAAMTGGNPILGRWTLVDTNMAAYCQSSQEFTADSSTTVKGGQTSTGRPSYLVGATAVTVSYGGPNAEEWDVNGPDDLTLRLNNPYGQANCRYHRS